MLERQAQQNYLSRSLPRAKDYDTKTSPQVRIKKCCPSLLPRYAIIARHFNVVNVRVSVQSFEWHFWREKK